MSAAEEPILLRPAQAAALLSVSRSKCYAMLQEGRLPVCRIAGAVRVPRAELLAWIESNTVAPVVSGGLDR